MPSSSLRTRGRAVASAISVSGLRTLNGGRRSARAQASRWRKSARRIASPRGSSPDAPRSRRWPSSSTGRSASGWAASASHSSTSQASRPIARSSSTRRSCSAIRWRTSAAAYVS